ncbi:MAG TPA: MFS transporter [Syntrophorhabdales bacterium]|nr:MFS transporter [Syntrophorhabdales bacterium]
MSKSSLTTGPAQAASEPRHLEHAWLMVACAWLLGFAMYAPMLCIPPIAHIITAKLLVGNAAVGLLFAVPVTALIALAIPSGFLADRLGTQKAVGIGAVVMAAGSLLRGISTSFSELMIFTIIYGVGFSIIYPNLPKLVGLWFPREKVGLATGVYSTGITTAGAVALAITLPLIYPLTNSIQGTFVIWSIPSVAAAVLWWLVAKDPPVTNSPLAQTAQRMRTHTSSYSLWKDKNMWYIALLLFFNDIHFYIWSGWSPAIFIMKGASPELAGLMASCRGWAGFPVIFLMPWASYKVGLRKPFMWGSALLLALTSWAAIYIPVPLGWPLMVLVGVATSGTFSMTLALPLELLPNEFAGIATGTVLSIGYIGGLLGPWLAGRIADATGSFNLALVVLAVTGILWAVVALLIPESGRRAREGT